MKIIALEKELPGVSAEQFAPHLKSESLRVWELLQSNLLREIYFRADRHSAVLILECTTIQEADQHLSTLPLVQAGLVAFELIPLAPYPGFARLFANP